MIGLLDLDNTFVAEENSSILGWITLSKVSNRCVYEGVGEISIYIHPEYKRKKVGARLYSHLEENAKKKGSTGQYKRSSLQKIQHQNHFLKIEDFEK